MTTTINASASAGLVQTADTSTILQLQTNGTAALTIDASQNVGIGTSSPGAPLSFGSTADAAKIFLRGNTNEYAIGTQSNELRIASYSATTFYRLGYAGTESMRIDSSGNLGIGTSSPAGKLHVEGGSENAIIGSSTRKIYFRADSGGIGLLDGAAQTGNGFYVNGASSYVATFIGSTERARIDSSGNLLVGKTALALGTSGVELYAGGEGAFTRSAAPCLYVNRLADDGDLVRFFQATTQEGSISVSGTTVSYNGGHLSRWAQTTTAKDDTLVKGTVLSNLDEMNVYTDADGNPVDNEQLNKVKVSDVEGDANVAGVFVNWSHDEDHNVDEINMAMTGDMIIRIAQGTTVVRGDLLMSAGDGTAKPQGDDIVRSKTVAKVTSTHVTCTYADGSYCVPCVLMAC